MRRTLYASAHLHLNLATHATHAMSLLDLLWILPAPVAADTVAAAAVAILVELSSLKYI